MIRHHIPTFEETKQNQFHMDQKKLVKTFVFHNSSDWIEYFTGFLFMEPNDLGKVDLKFRFSRHPHLNQIEAAIKYPLELFTDEGGLYTLIHQQNIKTVEKPEQNLLYLKIGQQGRILAISFSSKSYCKALLQHLTLVMENSGSDEMTWTDQNLKFLNASMGQNLMYVDSVFILEERIEQFCTFFNKVDKQLYLQQKKNPQSSSEKYMVQFFQIIKHVFLRANQKIILMFIEKQDTFETVLKCLSCNFAIIKKDNPFGVYHFNYLEQFHQMTVSNNCVAQLQNQSFWNNYELIAKIKFLRDVAICTFIQIPTEAVFNDLLNRAFIKILQTLGQSKNYLMKKLYNLAKKDQYRFICVFSQLWEIFKAVIEDIQTLVVKEMFYLEWVQNGLFSQTLSAMGRLLKKRQISDIHPRFWQKWLESMNPMLSYEWNQTQTMILHHQSSYNKQESSDLMNSLLLILANCDFNTKTLILDFVRVQIQVSENRKHISARYLTYLYDFFVMKSLQYCKNEENLEKYIEFVQKIYVAQPLRTRHFLIDSNFFGNLRPYLQDKYVFIMLLKLLKTFIEVGDEGTFVYLSMKDFYDCVRQSYAQNKKLQNVTNSLFLSIFKAIQTMTNKEGKMYLYRIFFNQQIQPKEKSNDNHLINQKQSLKTLKRSIPVTGLSNEMDIEK